MATNPTTFFITLVHIWMFLLNICNATDSINIPKFTSILIFGDSTVDTGNNNYIHTIVKANIYPYGKDYPGHIPTGRFSNGKLVPDFLASFLGIKQAVPPFLDPKLSDNDIRTGVNFASANTGFDDLTASISNVIPLSSQIGLFKKYIARLNGIVGEEEAKKIIGGSLVIFSAGTNDFAINFYDIPLRRLTFNISGYQDFLLNKLHDYVKDVYDLGCRKILITGLPPIGCLPIQMTAKLKFLFRTCLEDQNSDARSYNEKLGKLLPQIQAQLAGSKIIYADLFKPLSDMIHNPRKYGFVETKRGCCTGTMELSILCNSVTSLCENASQYIFWDSIHPTQTAYKYISDYLEKYILPKFITN